MNKEFIAAINQVCHDRQLPKEVVLEAVEAALVSAFRRKFGSVQNVTACMNPETGESQIFVEKEVVETVTDDSREISVDDARLVAPEAVVADLVLIDSTPDNFGRIAAQTARQVILQRIREAERDSLYHTYAEREGEIINGTVQSIDQQQVTLSLGKVEAVLPRPEQMPTERYSIGQRLRAYVSEVQKTSRGPMIVVSRTHKNMLRRLLELEVPEVFNGTVEIKAIAREAGYRSKVAVNALQEGVDPVGSCVGMRGVRIQSIVNELNGEKIDVVAWSAEPGSLIANGLSPAKVLNVILDEHGGDRTATVVVPDKQLSLAIGKEGQNARLAAKLTNWRIDIKSITEAMTETLEKVSVQEDLKELVSGDQDIITMAGEILSEKEGAMLSDGELQALSRAVQIVREAEVSLEKERAAARLQEAVVQALETTEPGVQRPVAGDADDLLAKAEAILAGDEAEQVSAEGEIDIDATADEVEPVAAAEEIVAQDLEEEDAAAAGAVEEAEPELEVKEGAEPGEVLVEAETDVVETEAAQELEQPEEKVEEVPAPARPVYVPPPSIPLWGEDEEIEEERLKEKGRRKKRELVFDEDLGEVVSHRKRKPGRQRESWEDY